MKVQLSISVGGLPNEEGSYYATVTGKEDGEVIGKTNPRVGNGTFQELLFLDDENASVNVLISAVGSEDSAIAEQSFDVSAVLNSYTKAKAKQATNDEASIALHVMERSNGKLRLILQGHDLPNTDFGLFGNQKTDPIYEIYNHLGKKVLRSNKVDDDLNPVWDEQCFDLEDLCGKRLDKPLRITVYDRDKGDTVEYLGSVDMTVQHMLDDASSKVPLLKGGSPVPGASLSVKEAELLPDEKVSRSVSTALEAALSALSNLEQLKEEVASLQEAADDAQNKAEAAQETAKEKQSAADVEAQKQLELQTKFSNLAKEATQVAAAAETHEFAGTFRLILAAQDLADVDFGIRNKSDPIYEVFVMDDNNNTHLIRSNKVDNDLNPVWEEQTFQVDQVKSLDSPLKILVSDRDGKEALQPLGYIESSINKLLDCKKAGNSFTIPLLDQPRPDKDTGRLLVKEAALVNFRNLKEEAASLRTQCEALKAELDAVTHTFGEVEKEAEEARKVAAEAAETANEAKEKVKAAKMAVETAEASI